MRAIPCTAMLVWLFFQTATALRANVPETIPPPPNGGPGIDDELIRLRFKLLTTPFPVIYDADVAAYLRSHLTYGQKDAEEMLGRSALVFPIFEHYLEMHGLPQELKYLPMVESSLVPYATSVSGAVGLWQFMPGTAQQFGLTIDRYLDERRDPYRSTEAAVKYLKKLHRRFGKWDMALAAYNCGPSRLSQIIEAAGSDDFWKIKASLPRETQRYVCRYLAALYLAKNYQLHGLAPVLPAEHILQGVAARVYEPVSLSQISLVTGVELASLKQLNPAFRGNFSPARQNGVFLVLPRNAWPQYLEGERKSRGLARP